MDFDPEVGVLIVHGIGTQKEGSELRQWVDAMLRYLDACPPPPQAGSNPRTLQPSPGDRFVRLRTPPLGGTTEGDRQRWLIGEAWWAEAFDVPDRKAVSRWMVSVSSWFLYLFVVRVWRRFAVDALHIVPGVAFALWVGWLFRQATGSEAVGGTELVVAGALFLAVLASLFRGAGKRLGGFVVVGTLLIGYPIAALVTAGAFVLWLVGLLPGRISEKARAMQLGLAQSVGDVYALIASRRREQVMFDAITAAATRLATAPGMENKPLVLLAHSQGAALTYRALNTDSGLRDVLAGRDVTVITYGAAIVPVHLLEQHLKGPKQGLRRLQGFAGFLGLLLFAFSLVRLAADGVDDVSRLVTDVSFPLVVASFVANWRQERRARCQPETVTVTPADGPGPGQAGKSAGEVCIGLRAPVGDKLRWVDLWAPWDPVPNGPLSVAEFCRPAPCGPGALPALSGTNEFLSCRVANLHQPWRDHVVYRDNHEDVVSRWVGEIAVRARPTVLPALVERPARPAETAAVGRTWRLKRGMVLLLGQVIALIGGFLVIASRWGELDDLGRRAARRLPLRSTLSSLADLVPEGARDGLLGQTRDPSHLQGLLVALILLLGAIVAASKVVTGWQKAATGAYLAGDVDGKLRAPGGLIASALAAVALVVLLVVAQSFDIDSVATRTVNVRPAVVVEAARTQAPSPHTTVRFEPIGTGDATPVIVELGRKAADVKLDGGVDYRITATATGGKDCIVSALPADRPTDVTVNCAASGAPLPRLPA